MKALSLSGVVAPVLFVLVTLIAAASTPGYDHVNQFISELGASGSSTASLMNYAGFIPTGAMLAIFGVVVTRRLARDRLGYVAGALLTLFGIGVLVAGFFSCDTGCPQAVGSLSNIIHDRVSPLAFLAAIFGVSLFAFRFRKDASWHNLWVYSLVTGLLALAFFAGVVSTLESRSYTGLWQRLMLLTVFTWTAVIGWRLYRTPSSDGHTDDRPT